MKKLVSVLLVLALCVAFAAVCGAEEVHEHSWVYYSQAPTCTTAGVESQVCTTCGESSTTTIPATGHSWSYHSQAPTFTADGVESQVCTVCGDSSTTTIPATGHTSVTVAGKDATCTATGLTDGEQCSVCGAVLKAQNTIPAKGHTEVVVPGK